MTGVPGFPGLGHQSRLFDGVVLRRSPSARGAPGPTREDAPRHRPVTPCVGVTDPRGPSRTHLIVVLQRLVRATDPKVRRGRVPVAPCVRTADPWIRRRRTPPSSWHSLRADNRARTPQAASSSPGRPHPAGHRLRPGHSTRPGACPSGRGHATPSGTAIPSPGAQDAPSRDARIRQAHAAGPHRSGWLTPIPAARRVRRGPPGAPGYGHRPAPAHCAGGP